MSLARQRVLSLNVRSIRASAPLVSKRLASSHPDHHDHHHAEDNTVYPQESFNTPFWRRTVLAIVAGYGIYKAYPLVDERGDYFQRYIKRYWTSPELWAYRNNKHLEQSMKQAEDTLLIHDAKRGQYRIRNPMTMDYSSAHNVPVGMTVDTSDVKIKKDDPWGP